MHTTHTSMSHFRSGSHVSHGEDTSSMQLEIDHLHRKLRRKQRKGSPSSTESPSNDDDSYRPQSRTPHSESFSYKEECYLEVPYMRKIDKANLPWQFTLPTFTMYNGRTDSVEHVSHFNQRMVVHSRNEALMCKVSPLARG